MYQSYPTYAHYYQTGGGVSCSLCGSPGTNKSTCPSNPKARRPNYEKHQPATGITQQTKPASKTPAKAKAGPKAKAGSKAKAGPKATSGADLDDVDGETFRLHQLKAPPVIERTILALEDPRQIDALCKSNKELFEACKMSAQIRKHLRRQRLIYATAWDGADPPVQTLHQMIKSFFQGSFNRWKGEQAYPELDFDDADVPLMASRRVINVELSSLAKLYHNLHWLANESGYKLDQKLDVSMTRDFVHDFQTRYPEFTKLLRLIATDWAMHVADHASKPQIKNTLERFHKSLDRLEQALDTDRKIRNKKNKRDKK